jgi:hypothetical protein
VIGIAFRSTPSLTVGVRLRATIRRTQTIREGVGGKESVLKRFYLLMT